MTIVLMPTAPVDLRTTDDLDDAALAVRAQGGDHRAFTVLMRRHDAALRRTVLWRTKHQADADDALQEAAVKIWRSLHGLREPAKVRAWILAIAAREALQVVIARRPADELFDSAALVAGPERSVERFDLHDGLRAALRRMPAQQAHVWVLRQLDGLSYRDIAARLEVPESSVRGSLVLARRRVQAAVGNAHSSARSAAGAGAVEGVAAPPVAPVKAAVAGMSPSPAPSEPHAAVRTAMHEDLELPTAVDLPGRRAIRV